MLQTALGKACVASHLALDCMVFFFVESFCFYAFYGTVLIAQTTESAIICCCDDHALGKTLEAILSS
jgi:hypothetical protein